MLDIKGGLVQFVRRQFTEKELRNSKAYYDTEIKQAGALTRIGLRDVAIPFAGFLVFVDRMPNANWGHPVTYLLTSEDFSRYVKYEEKFPPFGAELPDPWQVLQIDV